MVLEPKKTTVGYRCPHCGTGVLSVVGMLSLKADLLKLKCECGKSELTAVFTGDGSVRLSVPCLLCPKPHTFTVRKSLFFENDLFCLPCAYSDLNVCMIGETNRVKAELSRTELELLQTLEENGVESFAALHEETDDAEELPDPEIRDIVMYVVRDLDAEGKIRCRCERKEPPAPAEDGTVDASGDFDVEIAPDYICVTCRDCGASRIIRTDSYLAAHAFLNSDELILE